MKNKFLIGMLIAALGLGAFGAAAHAFVPIGKGVLHVLGVGLSVDPEQQTAPINTGTAVNTNLLIPDAGGAPLPGMPQEMMVVAELAGPGLTSPKTISARPGEQLVIPPLPQEGTYVLNNIRLMSGTRVVLYANPSMALIDTIRKLLITQVVSRPLNIDEIEQLGIRINPDNFTAIS